MKQGRKSLDLKENNWRVARAVEWARLESVCAFTGTMGSNPILSAMTILFGEEGQKVTTVIKASLMYPDLQPIELQKLLAAEEMVNMKPLSKEVIQSVIEGFRSRNQTEPRE
jgi:hypothetical protein